MKSLLLFPVSLKARNQRLVPDIEVVSEIIANYGVVEEYRNYFVLARNQRDWVEQFNIK